MLAEKRARILAAACAVLPGLFLALRAPAQTQVFVDNFNNGSVANSDTQTNFWQTIIDGSSTANEPVGGPITLSAQSGGAGDAYPLTEISSNSTQSGFNFFQQPVILQVSGLNYNAGTTLNALTEFNFGDEVLNAPAGLRTEYDEPTDFSLEICLPNGTSGGQVIMGYKADLPEASSPNDRLQIIGPKLNPVSQYPEQNLGGQIQSFSLILDSQFCYLSVVSATSPTNPTLVTNTYAATLNIPESEWNPSATYTAGDPVLNIETELNDTNNTTDLASLNIGQVKVSQMTMTWTNAGGDNNWFTPSNWSGLNVIDAASVTQLQGSSTALADIVVPDYTSSSATLPQVSTPTTINIDNGGGNTITLGTLNINSTQPYTINSTTIGLSTNGSTGQINVTAGSQIINAVNFNLYGNTAVNVAAGASLNLNGYLFTEATNYFLTKTGSGQLNVTNLQFFSAINVNGGTLQVMPSPSADELTVGASYINALSITSGKLDLTNNEMVIDYTGASPLQAVRGYLQSGTLMSSDASVANGTALGYAEATEIGQTNGFNPQNGQSIPTDSTSICILYTYDGDLNLDGVVNGADYALMVSGNGSDWYNGDLNYDGVENADDWSLFQLGAAFSARGNIMNFAVPEPGSVGLIAAMAVGLVQRRRRD